MSHFAPTYRLEGRELVSTKMVDAAEMIINGAFPLMMNMKLFWKSCD